MNDRTRNPLVWVAGAVAVLLVAAAVILAFFIPSGWARSVVVSRMQAALHRPVAVESAHVRLFPKARVELKGVAIGDTTQPGTPRVTIHALKVGCRWAPLLHHEVIVTDLLLDSPSIEMTLAPQNAPRNAPGAAAPAQAPFGLLLQKISVRDANVLVRSADGKPFFEMHRGSADLSARVGRGREFDLEAKADLPELLIHLPGGALGQDLPVKLEGTMHYDPAQEILTLGDTKIDLGGVPVALKGQASAMRSPSPVLDISLKGGPAEISHIVGFLPSTLFAKAKGIESKGTVTVEGALSGPLKKPGGPDYNVMITLRNGLVRSQGREMKNVAFALHATRDSIDVRDFTAESGASRMRGRGIVTGLPRSPWVSAAVDADLDLNDVAPFVSQSVQSLSGRVRARLTAEGPPRSPEQLQTTGDLTLSNVAATAPGLPAPLTAANGTIVLDRNALSFENVSAHLGSSDLLVRGTLVDFLALDPKHPNRGRARADLSVRSANLNLDELAPPPPKSGGKGGGGGAPAKAMPLPPVDGTIAFAADRVLVRGIQGGNFQGTAVIRGGVVTIQGLGMSAFGGTVAMNGTIDFAQHPAMPEANLFVTANDMDAGKLLESQPRLDRFGDVAGALSGRISGQAQVQGPLDSTLAVIPERLTSDGTVRILSGLLKDLPAQKKAADFLGLPQLATMKIDDWVEPFHIEKGRLFVQDLGIKSAGIEVVVNGWTALDGTLELRTDLWLPEELSARIRAKLPPELASLLTGTGAQAGRVLVPLLLSGKAKSPNVGIDSAALTEQARAFALQKLDAERQRIQQEAQNAAIQAARRAVGAPADTTARIDQNELKKRAQQELENRLGRLFGKRAAPDTTKKPALADTTKKPAAADTTKKPAGK